MSMGDANSKFPGQRAAGLPPSPSRENPGQVFPQSDPKAAPAETVPGTGGGGGGGAGLGNPYVLDDAFARLDGALGGVIDKVRGEAGAAGEDTLLRKLEGWRGELTQIRGGGGGGLKSAAGGARGREDESALGNQQEGGMFTD
ncbi:hypothetical protein C2E23DRAFT_138125 [Lenzites betulinus]|nr:hypothetical protein C2E23DRAFT_138125 [Lenzites betulinus]